MRTKTVRQWTYNDVRAALEVAHGQPVAGVKICSETGFLIEECPKEDQPASGDEERPGPPPF